MLLWRTKISQTCFFPHTIINLQKWDANQPLIPLLKYIGLTTNERINIKHKCIGWELVKKSLKRLILCSSGLVRDTGYTCSWIIVIILYCLFFSNVIIPLLQRSFHLIQPPGCILAFHFEGLDLFPLILVPSVRYWKAFIHCYELSFLH